MKRTLLFCVAAFVVMATAPVFAGGGSESAGGKTEIRWSHWKTLEVGEATINKMVDGFNKAHPEFTLVSVDGPFNGFYDKLVTQAQARNLPEVVMIQVDWVGAFARDNVIASIDPYVAKEAPGFLDQYYDAFKQQVNGKRYSLPVHSGCVAMFYNPDIFKAAGIAGPPKTWDELIDTAKKVTRANQYAVTGTLASEPPTNMTYDIYPLMFQAGAKVVDANNQPAFNSPEGVRALEFYKQLVQYSIPGVLQNGEKEKRSNFAGGNVAMMFEGPWGIAIQKGFNKDKEFEVVTLPKSNTTGTIVRGSLLALPAGLSGKKEEGAWLAIKYLTGPEGAEIFCSGSGDLPANKVAAAKPFITQNKYMKGFLDQMDLPNAQALPHLPSQVELNRLLTIEIQNFISGKKNAKQALDDAAAAWAQIINR
ncbi:MAG: ABC transporter substrate-binding protein [Spirochaetales bacterium]|jgi:ABC-type glycerol-3-phosphate transport system substrate-binding protein|nr:ABC transporter substrate-binding protein [Spirochaetales bacterium]